MKYTIEHAPVYATLKIELEQGEQFRAEAGAMISMSPTVELAATSSGKGIMGTLKAAVGGESIFATMFTAAYGDGEVILAPSAPGDIVQVALRDETWLAQRGAYLAGDPSLVLGVQGSIKAFVSGEGLFLSKISGTGELFLSSFGAIYYRDLAIGERYVVDTGHVVAFPSSVTYTIRKAARGIFSSLASGEGLVCEFMGPGRIYMQTRNVRPLANLLQPFMASSGA